MAPTLIDRDLDQDILCAELAEAPSEPPQSLDVNGTSMFDLLELLLKDQARLDALTRSPDAQRALIPRLMAIGLLGYAVFGVTLAIFFSAAGVWPEFVPLADWLRDPDQMLVEFAPRGESSAAWHWLDGSAWKFSAAFPIGLVGAIGVCLPSFYFYGLLAGVRASMLQVTTLALKGSAASAAALMGALPIYFAVVLALVVFDAHHGLVNFVCLVGLALPFIAGLWGTQSLYAGFVSLADTMKPESRCRRECFLRRLLISWSVCYTVVTPVMLFTLWETFSR